MATLRGILVAFCIVSAAGAAPAAAAAEDTDQSHLSVISGDSAQWRRDPFVDSAAKRGRLPAGGIRAGLKNSAGGTGQSELDIQGIMQTDKKAFHALINGRVVKTGDRLDGLTIKEISRYRVVFRDGHNNTSSYDIFQGRIDRGKQ